MTLCPVCRDSGIVQCPEPDGTGMYETACPEPVHDNARDIGAQRAAELFAKAGDENWAEEAPF